MHLQLLPTHSIEKQKLRRAQELNTRKPHINIFATFICSCYPPTLLTPKTKPKTDEKRQQII